MFRVVPCCSAADATEARSHPSPPPSNSGKPRGDVLSESKGKKREAPLSGTGGGQKRKEKGGDEGKSGGRKREHDEQGASGGGNEKRQREEGGGGGAGGGGDDGGRKEENDKGREKEEKEKGGKGEGKQAPTSTGPKKGGHKPALPALLGFAASKHYKAFVAEHPKQAEAISNLLPLRTTIRMMHLHPKAPPHPQLPKLLQIVSGKTILAIDDISASIFAALQHVTFGNPGSSALHCGGQPGDVLAAAHLVGQRLAAREVWVAHVICRLCERFGVAPPQEFILQPGQDGERITRSLAEKLVKARYEDDDDAAASAEALSRKETVKVEHVVEAMQATHEVSRVRYAARGWMADRPPGELRGHPEVLAAMENGMKSFLGRAQSSQLASIKLVKARLLPRHRAEYETDFTAYAACSNRNEVAIRLGVDPQKLAIIVSHICQHTHQHTHTLIYIYICTYV